ncbi:hypothetical protein DY000_02009657 [Brassica cretica]|uniref:NAD-dependent epimerase/dehydratase domain-containing protein n=1 Tax=Brassica cretica TaxID=69181 RepID=A0ABQ7BYV9_BRACR|nr:hypothetical protein DY000_02009657 [Brassica cretica]
MSDHDLFDFHRYFNVIGSDPEGRLGEAPKPELREHGRISGACFDAARGVIPGLQVKGTDYKTGDGTFVRDYIDVTDLVDAHVKALEKAKPRNVESTIYFNVIGSDPEGRLGEAPKPELREHGRISGACFDAARGVIPGLQVKGTDYKTGDGTFVRTGKGRSVKEFVEACKKAAGVDIQVDFLPRRPGDYAEVYSDPAKILRDLNWSARFTNLQESLELKLPQAFHEDGDIRREAAMVCVDHEAIHPNLFLRGSNLLGSVMKDEEAMSKAASSVEMATLEEEEAAKAQ